MSKIEQDLPAYQICSNLMHAILLLTEKLESAKKVIDLSTGEPADEYYLIHYQISW
jgi:hypothetical protein